MNHWLTVTAKNLTEVIEPAELAVITAGDPDGAIVEGVIMDVVETVREAISTNPANVLDREAMTIPRTLKPEALDMIAWRLLKRFAVAVSEERDRAHTVARERLEAVRNGTHRVIDPAGKMPVPPGKRPFIQGPRAAYGSGGPGLFPSPVRWKK